MVIANITWTEHAKDYQSTMPFTYNLSLMKFSCTIITKKARRKTICKVFVGEMKSREKEVLGRPIKGLSNILKSWTRDRQESKLTPRFLNQNKKDIK